MRPRHIDQLDNKSNCMILRAVLQDDEYHKNIIRAANSLKYVGLDYCQFLEQLVDGSTIWRFGIDDRLVKVDAKGRITPLF